MKQYTTMKVYGGRETPAEFRDMTRDEVVALASGQHVWFASNDGSARRLKINGRVRQWVRNTERIEVPVKYGMYEYDTLNERTIGLLLVRRDEEISKFAALKEMINA